MSRSTIVRAYVLAAVAAGLLAAAVPSPATAATFKSGFATYVSTSASLAAGTGGQVTATCPAPRRLSGVGATIAGPAITSSPSSRIAASYPADGPDPDIDPDDVAVAKLHNGHSATAFGRADAICLAGGAGGSNLAYQSAPSAFNPFTGSSGTGQVSTCPGTRIVGGGQRITGLASEESLRGNGPNVMSNGKVDSTAWQTTFNVNGSPASPHSAFVHGICLGGSKLKLRYRYATRVLFADQVKAARARCPGKKRAKKKNRWRVIGGGWQGVAGEILVSRPFDSRDRGKAPDNGWLVRAHQFAGGRPLALVSFAICAKRR